MLRDAMDLAGVDPFDALRTPQRWLRLLFGAAHGRQAVVQLRKRLPFELSGLLGVEPFVMAKTVGCALAARSREQAAAGAVDHDELSALVRQAEAAGGNVGDGAWGYEFDVQTRWAFYPAGSPNLIATAFVGRGFGEAGVAAERTEWKEESLRAARFIARQLAREADGAPYFAYTPSSPRLIHNANLLGAGLLAAGGALDGDQAMVAESLAAARTSIRAQCADGSWPYGEGGGLGWSDNFHTAYNLDGLLLVWLATGDESVGASLRRATEHWTRDFFGPEGEPKYYPRHPYPYDIHSAGTAIDVAARLATWGFDTGDLARRVAAWTKRNLIDSETGRTYYQMRRLFTDKRNFVRWGDAHLALGGASLTLLEAGIRSPLENAVAEVSGVAA